MKKTVLLVDIGNTSATLGISRGAVILRKGALLTKLSTTANVAKSLKALKGGLRLDGAVISSVAPSRNRAWISIIKKQFGLSPLVVSHHIELGIDIDYPRPATIGADRLVNAAAVLWLYGAPAIIADFGTALTFDVIDSKGAYCGGVIAPGLPLMLDYMHDRTELLPRISVKGAVPAYGRSTEDAMRVGARIGYSGMVDSITRHMLPGVKGKVKLVATGGYARTALRRTKLPYVINPNLTLIGLARIFMLNNV